MQNIIAFDFETYLVSGENLIPKPVCITASDDGEAGYIDIGDGIGEVVENLFFDDTNILVAHSTGFDVSVALRVRPDLAPDIWKAMEEGRVQCTIMREKLLDLHEFGKIGYRLSPDNTWRDVRYSLAALVYDYFSIDISEDKISNDAWRLNYDALDGVPLAEWPEKAVSYAVNDSILTRRVYDAQERRARRVQELCGVDPLKTAGFRSAVSVALYLMGARGVAIDPEKRAEVVEWVEKAQSPENYPLLVSGGFLTPGSPPKPYANGAKDADGNPKMTMPTRDKIGVKLLKQHVVEVCEANGVSPLLSEKTGEPSLKAEWLEEHYGLSPVLTEYHERQKLEKLRTTEIPRISQADVVHPRYDALKITGRTSSSASESYPSINIQNVDPRVRPVVVPRPGNVLFSLDYSQLELVTAAQTVYDIVGRSVLRDKINAGVDTHAYLGAQLAYAFDQDFREECDRGGADTKEDRYEVFLALRRTDAKAFNLYKHYRKMAKPTGLGYPGGLGANTFVAYAKGTYGLSISVEEAKAMKEVWFQTYPEFEDYFAWVNEQVDSRWSEPGDDRYYYITPMGMLRPNCRFTEIANGKALQSPSAEGALTAVFRVAMACFDQSAGSILYGRTFPIGFIHDEIMGEMEDDEEYWTEAVDEIAFIMVESMRETTPDVQPRVEACLMRRWHKEAEPVYDKDGRIRLWEPRKGSET